MAELQGNVQNQSIIDEHDPKIPAKKVTIWLYDSGSDTSSRVTASNPLPISASSAYDIRLDDTTTANVTYIGKAALTGSAIATSSAVWQVQKIDETTGMIITWADGDSSFNNIWDNRASLTYA